MDTRNTPPENGLSDGPIMVACQWNMSSPTGPERKLNYKVQTTTNTKASYARKNGN